MTLPGRGPVWAARDHRGRFPESRGGYARPGPLGSRCTGHVYTQTQFCRNAAPIERPRRCVTVPLPPGAAPGFLRRPPHWGRSDAACAQPSAPVSPAPLPHGHLCHLPATEPDQPVPGCHEMSRKLSDVWGGVKKASERGSLRAPGALFPPFPSLTATPGMRRSHRRPSIGHSRFHTNVPSTPSQTRHGAKLSRH